MKKTFRIYLALAALLAMGIFYYAMQNKDSMTTSEDFKKARRGEQSQVQASTPAVAAVDSVAAKEEKELKSADAKSGDAFRKARRGE